MKLRYPLNYIVILLLLQLLVALPSSAQLDSCNAFLKGAYIEVGVNTNGAYGSSIDAPAGFHPKGGAPTEFVCGHNCPVLGEGLGFVADPDKDGWTVGTPYPYYGDYFLPGDPQEGWAIEIDYNYAKAWNGGGFDACGGTPYSSPLLSGKNVSYSAVGPRVSTVWQGKMDSVNITQLTTLDTNTVYFTVYITLTNKSSKVKKDVMYLRTLDPDNAQPESGQFTTDNIITYQLPNPKNRTLVTAIGTGTDSTGALVDIPQAYLGLGTLDCRAKCFIIKTSLTPDYGNLDSMYGAYGGIGDTMHYIYGLSDELVQDVGVGLVFKLGDLQPHDSVSFAYAYVLRQADLDSAFLSTQPRWIANDDSIAHATQDTALVCKNSWSTISIVNGSYYNWQWYGSDLDTTKGTVVHVKVGTTVKSIMAVGSTASCASDTLIIELKPDLSPPPVGPGTITYCRGAVAAPLTAIGQNLLYYNTNDSTEKGVATLIPSTTSVGTTTYYASQTVRGCMSDRTPITVTITPPLPALGVHENGLLCLGDTLRLFADSAVGYTYQWNGPDLSSTDQNPTLPGIKLRDTTYVMVADSANCPTYPSVVHVPLHAIIAEIGADRNKVCLGDSLHIYFSGITPDTGTNYTWGFGEAIVESGSGGGPYVVRWDTVGTKTITLHITNWRCASDTAATFTVATAPAVGFDIKKNVCVADTTSLQVANYSLPNAVTINVNGDGANVINGSTDGNYTLSWNTAGYKVVQVEVTYPQCARIAADSVDVHSLPPAQVQSISRNDICVGDTVTFAGVKSNGYTYEWNPVGYFRNYQQTNNTAIGAVQASGEIYLTVIDQYGCQATDSIYMNTQPCCIVALPSAFTPNGDGLNDVFRPITTGHHELKVFRVVNRWGQTVFESNNEKLGWDGKFNGVPQDIDTYFWYLNFECDGKTVEEQGEVTLIR